MKIGKEIALEAKKKNICGEWSSEMLKQNDIKPLCDMYFKGDDWAMKNDFPGVETIRRFKGNSDQHGLYVDFRGEIENKEKTALFGNSDAELQYSGYFAGKLIIRHNSIAQVRATGNAVLYVNLLDNAIIDVSAEEKAKVVIYQYGKESQFTITGNVDVKEKKWK